MASHSRRVVGLALWASLPAAVAALLLLWNGSHSTRVEWTGTLFIVGILVAGLFLLHERVERPLQTISNLLAAMREGDFSLRARSPDPDDSLGLLYVEANSLADMLRGQRLGAIEATTLLRTVITEIDAALFTFDEDGRLVMVNRGGERLLGEAGERLVGRSANDLGLDECLGGDTPRVLERRGPRASRWELRRTAFRQDGRPHHLVVLTDVSRTLQAEEREAWQRLIRVLSHEINNSLTPIRSFAGTLRALLDRPRTEEDDEDLRRGLDIIAQRSESLGRFIAAYARLARLPPPMPRPLDVGSWVARAVALEPRRQVRVQPGPQVQLMADIDQVDQLLINLVRNAVDAVEGTSGDVQVSWRTVGTDVEVTVADEGTGLADTANLYVPFYTTKPGGSGIGLALSRRIAEAHGGTLRLENRADRQGCRAMVRLPRDARTLPAPAIEHGVPGSGEYPVVTRRYRSGEYFR